MSLWEPWDNEQGKPQLIKGGNKTKYFKIPRPEGITVTPPPPPKSREQKHAERKAKKEAKKQKKLGRRNSLQRMEKSKKIKGKE